MKIFFGKNYLINGFITLSVFGLIVLGCSNNDEKVDLEVNKDSNSNQEKAEVEKQEAPKNNELSKADASKGELPEDDELKEMVRRALLDFDNALKTADFTDFHSKAAKPLQKTKSPSDLKNKFQSFIDGKSDVSSVKNLEPEYVREPRITKKGNYTVLEIMGKFPTNPKATKFKLDYIAEGKDWKLSFFDIDTTVYPKNR